MRDEKKKNWKRDAMKNVINLFSRAYEQKKEIEIFVKQDDISLCWCVVFFA